MVLLRCLAVAVALCYQVSAGPCRPRSSATVAAPSTVLTDDLASSTVLSALSSDGLGSTTLSTGLEVLTTTLSSTSLVVSLDSTLAGSSDTILTYESSVSAGASAPTSTSIAFSSIETGPSSDTSTTEAAATTTTLSSETAASPTSWSTSDYESSTLSETTTTDSTISDGTATNREAPSLTTEETGTSTSQAASSSETTNADSTTSDSTTTSTEILSLTTEETGTFTSQVASSSEDTSSVTTSDQPSAGTETSTAETTSSETSTVESSSVETTTVKTTSVETTSAETSAKTSTASTTEEATTTTTMAEPNQPTKYFINGGFEIPNDNGEYNGAPSLLGRSVTIKTDPLNALSGTHYAELAFPLAGPAAPYTYAVRQSLTGLDPAKRYAYTYNWAPTGMVPNNAQNPYLKFTTNFGTVYYEFEYRGEVSPADRYVKRKIVFGGITPATADAVQTRVQFVGLTSGSVRFDDISIFEYDPPCTLINLTPSNKVCGRKGSVYGLSKAEKVIAGEQSLSLEDCVESCHLESTCHVISYLPIVGNNIGRCWRYKVPQEDMEFVENGGGQYVYEPECFSFR